MKEFDDLLEGMVEKAWDDTLETADPTGLSPEELDSLVHALTARRLIEHLRVPGASPGVIQCALRFLKDNDINGLALPGSASEGLKKAMADRLPFKPKLTGTD